MCLRAIVLIGCLALTQAEMTSLSCKHIRAFVEGHNQRRLQVASGRLQGQPPAQDMTHMVWDEELAAKAEAWAARKIFEHNPEKSIGSGRFIWVGENLFMAQKYGHDTNIDTIPEDAMRMWFEEHKQYTFGPLKHSDFGSGPMIGHYTQMVWAKSAYVGCAISKWRENNGIKYLVVCNYGPAGNYLGQTPYVQGGPISKLTCPTGNCQRPYGMKCSRKSYI